MNKMQEPTLEKEKRGTFDFINSIGIILIHLAPIALIWTGATLFDWILCFSLYFVRMFFVTAGYHRYFSHRTFKTSRWFQFILAFFAETSAQKGVLWWAAHHREHHRYSDQPQDPHSAKLYGFWYSHIGWIVSSDFIQANYNIIGDFSKYKELRWLDKNYLFPPFFLATLITFVGGWVNGGTFLSMFTDGWTTLLAGFFLSTVLLYHGTFSINSLMHRIGFQRYQTGDESRNSLWLALITLGEGWHNNHHYYQSTVRQGFYWWEIDITYYVLKVLSWVGIVWDLKGVPAHVRNARSLEEAKKMAKNNEIE
ncbi:MAG: acyl-CoA desaturase [Microscillaceae bacterium]|jgi:stearoyl-CoA desaturase (delta-9 desaturase)|nr:acyl-CoA desaturase [Microscillaceae bacterium]